jgi:hypothetical protein
MVEKADEKKKGIDTVRPPAGDDAADLYSSETIVRDTPSDLVELIKQTNAAAAPTSPPPSTGKASKNEPPLSTSKPAEKKPSAVPNKVDDLWEAMLPKRSADDDDDDDEYGASGSASGHAAEDVTKMLVVPEGLLPEDPLAALSPEALRRIAEAQPSIVVADDIPVTRSVAATKSSVPPARSSVPPAPSSVPPPADEVVKAKKEEPDEGIVTSPGRNVPDFRRQRLQTIALTAAAVIVLMLAVYYAVQP